MLLIVSFPSLPEFHKIISFICLFILKDSWFIVLCFGYTAKWFGYIYTYVCKSLQSCPTLCNLVNCSPPAPSVHGILQARILEWVAMPFSRDLPNSGSEPMSLSLLHWQECSLPLAPPGKPNISRYTYICTYILFFKFFSIRIYCKILNILPCAIQ